MSYDALIAYVGTPKRGHARIDEPLRVPDSRRRDTIGLKDTKNQNIIVRHSVQERRCGGAREDASAGRWGAWRMAQAR